MKKSLLILTFALIASSAFAQEDASRPDYSRPTLMRVLAVDAGESEGSRLRFSGGAVSFIAFNTRFRLPLGPMLPLAGSRPVVSQVLPDAFSLTNTAYASLPRTWGTPYERSEDLLDLKVDRSRMRVVVRSNSQ